MNVIFDFECFSYINTVERKSLRMPIENDIQIMLLHTCLLAVSLHYILVWEERCARFELKDFLV